jgi:hypothetical protein
MVQCSDVSGSGTGVWPWMGVIQPVIDAMRPKLFKLGLKLILDSPGINVWNIIPREFFSTGTARGGGCEGVRGHGPNPMGGKNPRRHEPCVFLLALTIFS